MLQSHHIHLLLCSPHIQFHFTREAFLLLPNQWYSGRVHLFSQAHTDWSCISPPPMAADFQTSHTVR
ncbi:hypothetical protein MARPO_0084s0033 [Marchantia polymorpha]|uniref:Uncharacterized protein n=1 Tax=Marchantia polymorpha TaxID=3197 RepID=A0A2R6WJC3_MARPO|nr:hypothetical protein MARPO_0084s0033 [Marchantia polymorpha]|eukprot:PTQ33944.1 hypothetical protein MARPO_0084s0033 [Marchantia polymorpha]